MFPLFHSIAIVFLNVKKILLYRMLKGYNSKLLVRLLQAGEGGKFSMLLITK